METKEQINLIYNALHMRETTTSTSGEQVEVLSLQGEQRELLKARLVELLLSLKETGEV
ncbi:MAG: hypothetical protein RBT74_10900 [Tenuifilaceae bacterium]|jgi:hypothetical protein|nr:hypothetical protein [Tenuifilaceae bacterium]